MSRALSSRELCAFERLIVDDHAAAQALCFPPRFCEAPARHEARARALMKLTAARALDHLMKANTRAAVIDCNHQARLKEAA